MHQHIFRREYKQQNLIIIKTRYIFNGHFGVGCKKENKIKLIKIDERFHLFTATIYQFYLFDHCERNILNPHNREAKQIQKCNSVVVDDSNQKITQVSNSPTRDLSAAISY